MLNINPEIVCNIILRAKEFQAKEGVVIPEDQLDTSYEIDPLQVLADHRDDLSYQEVSILINDLEKDQQITLIALMYVGRGDYELSEWSVALKVAAENWNPNTTAKYLLAHPSIVNYLEEALMLFGYSCDT